MAPPRPDLSKACLSSPPVGLVSGATINGEPARVADARTLEEAVVKYERYVLRELGFEVGLVLQSPQPGKVCIFLHS